MATPADGRQPVAPGKPPRAAQQPPQPACASPSDSTGQRWRLLPRASGRVQPLALRQLPRGHDERCGAVRAPRALGPAGDRGHAARGQHLLHGQGAPAEGVGVKGGLRGVVWCGVVWWRQRVGVAAGQGAGAGGKGPESGMVGPGDGSASPTCSVMSEAHMASCRRVTPCCCICHCASRSYACGMTGEGSAPAWLWLLPGAAQAASASAKNSLVRREPAASPASTATAPHPSCATMRLASSSAVTGPAPPAGTGACGQSVDGRGASSCGWAASSSSSGRGRLTRVHRARDEARLGQQPRRCGQHMRLQPPGAWSGGWGQGRPAASAGVCVMGAHLHEVVGAD
jgi:hypothetical protein